MPKDNIENVSSDKFFSMADDSIANDQVDELIQVEEEIIAPAENPVVVIKKTTGDDSVKALKQKLDNIEKEKAKLDAKIIELQKLNELEPLKPVAEYLKTKNGKIDEETVNSFISKGKERKQKLSELEQKNIEKDNKIKEMDILQSEEYIEKYSKPWSRAENQLLANLCPVDDEGNPKDIELIQLLKNELLNLNKDGSIRTSMQIKGAMSKFARLYEEKTQKPFIIPSVEKIENSILSVFECAKSASNARKNWDEDKVQTKVKKEYEASVANESMMKKELQGRQFITNTVLNEFKYEDLKGVLEEEEVKTIIKDKNNKFIKFLKGEEQPYTYKEMIQLSFKSEAYDKVLEKLRATEKLLAAEQKKRGSGLPARSTDRRPTIQQQPTDKDDEDEIESASPDKLFEMADNIMKNR